MHVLALRARDRYKVVLDRLLDFCAAAGVKAIDAIDLAHVENFVKWLRGRRARNRSRGHYRVGGVKFILSTGRTAYNWAVRRRMLPPYAEHPFGQFAIDDLKDPTETEARLRRA